MSAAKHTPGPWHVTFCGEGSFQIHNMPECFESTVLCSRYPYLELKDEFEANARLMAAAPDLLAALQGFINHGTCFDEQDMKAACAAIAKATGAAA